MRISFLHAALLTSLLALTAPATATPIEFVPIDSTVDLGDTVSVDIVVTPDAGVLIGAFDIILSFDEAIVSVADVLFSNALGLAPFDVIQADADLGGGSHLISALSLLLDFTGFQAGDGSSFSLATIVFDTEAIGQSALGFDSVVLSDFFGLAVANPPQPGSGLITVQEPPIVVSAPSTLPLMTMGLLLLLLGRRSKASFAKA